MPPTETPDTPTADAAPMQWSDAYLLGYGPMDALHEEFVILVHQLQTAPDAELPGLLDAFAEHAQRHFSEEEAWMEETDFPARGCHADEHAAVMKSVHEVREVLAQGRSDVCRSLAQALADWFPGHADYLDSALSHWMCKRRLGGKPVVIRRNLQKS